MGSFYSWLWYHTEFWLPPDDRRPFTFIIRDFYHQTPVLFILLEAWVVYLIGRRWDVSWWVWLLVTVGIVIGHCFWAGKYQEGEQEWPPYNPDDRR